MRYARVLVIRESWVFPDRRHRYRCMRARSLSQRGRAWRRAARGGCYAVRADLRLLLVSSERGGRVRCGPRTLDTSRGSRRGVEVNGIAVRQGDCVAGSRRSVSRSSSASKPASKYQQFLAHKSASPTSASQPASTGSSGSTAANPNCRSNNHLLFIRISCSCLPLSIHIFYPGSIPINNTFTVK